jgi:cytochrome c peroxidase
MRTLVALSLAITTLSSVRSAPLGLDLYRAVPADNPLTPPKIALGRRLFQDRDLSRDGTLSCAVCHDPSRGFANNRVVASGPGGTTVGRNVPTLINRAYGESFFWDGRAESLEQQVVQPLLNPSEMAMTPDAVIATVRQGRGYTRQFRAAFGRAPQLDDVARALASYVRTIRSGNSRYDRFRTGVADALTPQEQRGMRVFFGTGRCGSCHSGPNLTDERFHNTGVSFRDGDMLDAGRFIVTRSPADRGAFKTPTLREVARTAPYMHDGSVATLDQVVDYYDRGGNANPGLDAILRPIGLTVEDKRALVAFLRVLSGEVQHGW